MAFGRSLLTSTCFFARLRLSNENSAYADHHGKGALALITLSDKYTRARYMSPEDGVRLFLFVESEMRFLAQAASAEHTGALAPGVLGEFTFTNL